jgi:ABC-type dipeptide/oligopeptide/nickel transport system permease subunit
MAVWHSGQSRQACQRAFGCSGATGPAWQMLASARDYIDSAWWIVTMPGLSILISVLAINLLGDGLRDALDPKLKRMA